MTTSNPVQFTGIDPATLTASALFESPAAFFARRDDGDYTPVRAAVFVAGEMEYLSPA